MMNNDGLQDSRQYYGYLSVHAAHRSAVWCLSEMVQGVAAAAHHIRDAGQTPALTNTIKASYQSCQSRR